MLSVVNGDDNNIVLNNMWSSHVGNNSNNISLYSTLTYV